MSEEKLFSKKTIYHSGLTKAGAISVKVTSEPIKSKFTKKGEPDQYFIDIKFEGEDHQIIIENEQCLEALTGLKGKTVVLEASGSREDAEISIAAASGGAPEKQAPKPADKPSAGKPAPAADPDEKAKQEKHAFITARRGMARRMVLHRMAITAAIVQFQEAKEAAAESGIVLTEHTFTSFVATLFIEMKSHVDCDKMPMAWIDLHKEPAKPAPKPQPKPEPEPEPAAEDDSDDIPF